MEIYFTITNIYISYESIIENIITYCNIMIFNPLLKLGLEFLNLFFIIQEVLCLRKFFKIFILYNFIHFYFSAYYVN